jgi:hypothetical protein
MRSTLKPVDSPIRVYTEQRKFHLPENSFLNAAELRQNDAFAASLRTFQVQDNPRQQIHLYGTAYS